MKTQYRIIQTECSDARFVYKYNVQVWKYADNKWWYAGIGRYCRTLDDAFAYIKEQEANTEE